MPVYKCLDRRHLLRNAWRSSIPTEDRLRVCRYILFKLCVYSHHIPPRELREHAIAFEAQCFIHAVSFRDYIAKLVAGILRLQAQGRFRNVQTNGFYVNGHQSSPDA